MASRLTAAPRGQSHGLIDNFFLTDAELEDSPSRRDGVDAETESMLRVFGCELIQMAVRYLRAPQAVAATGQVLLHRFYCKRSLKEFDIQEVAQASTWLAAKLEEYPAGARPSAVLRVFHRMEARREGRPLESLQTWAMGYKPLQERMFVVESHMLRAFGFVAHVEHPHKFVLSLLQAILSQEGPILQEAWNLANDSLRTTMCVRFKSETVACGIVFVAARRCKVALPENKDWCPSGGWWDLCGVPKADVYAVAAQLHDLYSLPKASYVKLERVKRAHHAPGSLNALAAQASPVSAPPPAAAGDATAGSGGGEGSKGGGSARASGDAAPGEGLSTGRPAESREAASRDNTAERRAGSDGDTGTRSERSARAEQGSKRDREPPAADRERDCKRRREDQSEHSDQPDRGADRGGDRRDDRSSGRPRDSGDLDRDKARPQERPRDRDRDRPRGEYPVREGYREDRGGYRDRERREERARDDGREREGRSRDYRQAERHGSRAADRPRDRSYHPDEDRGYRRTSRPSTPGGADAERDRDRGRERAGRPDSGPAANGRPAPPERPSSRAGYSDRGSDRGDRGGERGGDRSGGWGSDRDADRSRKPSWSPIPAPGSSSKPPRPGPDELREVLLKRPRVERPPGLTPPRSHSTSGSPRAGSPAAAAAKLPGGAERARSGPGRVANGVSRGESGGQRARSGSLSRSISPAGN